MIMIIFLIVVEILFIYLIKNDILLIFSYPCLLVFLILLANFSIKSNNILTFVSDVVTNNNIVDNYRIVVLRGKYKKLEDLENKKIGYTKDTIGFNNLKITFESYCYDSVDYLIEDLNSGKIDAAVILYNQYSNLQYEKYEIIYKYEFSEEIIPVTKNMSNTSLIYISATDNYESDDSTGKSDVNIVAGINYRTKQILLILIPRDYYVLLPSKNEKDRLSYAGIYGIGESIKTVENLLETKIDYYLKINFSSLEKLIDKIGGIEVNSDYNFVSSGVEFKLGLNYLNGEEALIFARERKGLIGGDRTNGENQERVIESVLKKVLKSDKYFNNLNLLSELIKTNIPRNDILKLIKNQIAYEPNWNVTKYVLNGFDNYEYTYSYKCCKLNVIEPDVMTIHEAMTLIEYLQNDGVFN